MLLRDLPLLIRSFPTPHRHRLVSQDLRLLWRLLRDGMLLNIGWYAAYLIRFQGLIDPKAFRPYLKAWWVLTLLHLLMLWKNGRYQRNVLSERESFWGLLRAVGSGVLLSFSFLYLFRLRVSAFPSSILLLGVLLNTLFLWSGRIFLHRDPLYPENAE